MIIKKKNTFSISSNPHINLQLKISQINQSQLSIKYFTDAVYRPLTYDINFHILKESQTTSEFKQPKQPTSNIQMDFGFLINQIQFHKRILDNIGVIVIKNQQLTTRFGILITEENGIVFASLIQ